MLRMGLGRKSLTFSLSEGSSDKRSCDERVSKICSSTWAVRSWPSSTSMLVSLTGFEGLFDFNPLLFM